MIKKVDIVNRDIDPQPKAAVRKPGDRPASAVGGALPAFEAPAEDRGDETEELRCRAVHLETLNAIIVGATASCDLQSMLETSLDRTLQAMGLTVGAAWAGDHIVVRGLNPALAAAAAGTWRSGVLGDMLDNGFSPVVGDWEQIANRERWAEFDPTLLQRAGFRAFVAVPILAHGTRLGGFGLASAQPHSWSVPDIMFVESVGRQLGVMAERLQLLEEARERGRRMTQLARLSEGLNRPVPAGTMLTIIGDGALSLSGAQRLALYLHEPDGTVSCPWARGLSGRYVSQVLAHVDVLPGSILRERPQDHLLIGDVGQLPADAPSARLLRPEGIQAVALWPMIYEEKAVAVVACYYDEAKSWSSSEREVMQAFARQSAAALMNSRLQDSLQALNDHLHIALQAKNDMIQMVSHELRTPLSIIFGYLEMLLDDIFGALPAELIEIVQIMAVQSQQLDMKVKQILTLQTLDEKQLLNTPVNLASLLRDVMLAWDRQAGQHGIRLELDLPKFLPAVRGDAPSLRQCIDSLLDNAIKFSLRGGLVRLSAKIAGNTILIAVADDGIGISEHDMGQLFAPFYQADRGTTRRFGGLGIGLALCRSIIEKHEGQVWAESEGAQQGSVFYIALPVATGQGPVGDRVRRDGFAAPK